MVEHNVPENTPVSLEEYLNENGTLVYTNVGTSMLPLLRQNKDLFIVEKKGPERCRRGDVVLYTRRMPESLLKTGEESKTVQYILHRIVEVLPDGYVLLGDNCLQREYGIHENDIIGVMTGFVRDGKQHNINEPAYKFYSILCLYGAPVRITGKKALSKICRYVKGTVEKRK